MKHAARLVAVLLLLLLAACKAFDPERLKPAPLPNGMQPDTGVPMDGSMPMVDGSMPEAGAQDGGMDAIVIDAELDGGDATIDLPCGTGDGERDCCPEDDDKVEPGVCGCGESDADSDGDDLADCLDGCDDNPDKTAPGTCGCDAPDESADGGVTCSVLVDALAHRYRFEGAGVSILDTAGDSDGLLIGASLTDDGTCSLAGEATEQYVDLPNDVIASLTNVTIEVWMEWTGDADNNWARIFDFGNTTAAAEGAQGTGSTFIFLSPRPLADPPGTPDVMRLVYALTGSTGQTAVTATRVFPSGGVHHTAAVFDDSNDQMRLYIDGVLEGSATWTGALSSITYVNNWLGRSQYIADDELGGVLHEARIYGAALTDEEVAFSFEQGSDPSFLP